MIVEIFLKQSYIKLGTFTVSQLVSNLFRVTRIMGPVFRTTKNKSRCDFGKCYSFTENLLAANST